MDIIGQPTSRQPQPVAKVEVVLMDDQTLRLTFAGIPAEQSFVLLMADATMAGRMKFREHAARPKVAGVPVGLEIPGMR